MTSSHILPYLSLNAFILISCIARKKCSTPQRHYEKTSKSNWKRNTKHKKVWFGQSLLQVNWGNRYLGPAYVSQKITFWNTFLSSTEMPRKAPPHHSLVLGPIEKCVLIMYCFSALINALTEGLVRKQSSHQSALRPKQGIKNPHHNFKATWCIQ